MIHRGDLFDVLPTLDAESIDACITDPPYELGFMGRRWDSSGVAFKVETWIEVLRPLKPGAYLMAFGGTRTFHRLACAIEDAGFEIRDCLSWLYGQGFPKSLNLGDGRGTALKPGWEPIVLARKPTTGTVKANAERYGTGVLNIDACRLEPMAQDDPSRRGLGYGFAKAGAAPTGMYSPGTTRDYDDTIGRWPANVLLDEEAAAMLDEQSGVLSSHDTTGIWSGSSKQKRQGVFTTITKDEAKLGRADRGGASRFYYVAKPSREERNYGCGSNGHPTVKPIELMRWLVKLVTPPNGTVLDPFCGSGTTGMACRYELRQFIGIEREADYVAIAERRIAACAPLFPDEAQIDCEER